MTRWSITIPRVNTCKGAPLLNRSLRACSPWSVERKEQIAVGLLRWASRDPHRSRGADPSSRPDFMKRFWVRCWLICFYISDVFTWYKTWSIYVQRNHLVHELKVLASVWDMLGKRFRPNGCLLAFNSTVKIFTMKYLRWCPLDTSTRDNWVVVLVSVQTFMAKPNGDWNLSDHEDRGKSDAC